MRLSCTRGCLTSLPNNFEEFAVEVPGSIPCEYFQNVFYLTDIALTEMLPMKVLYKVVQDFKAGKTCQDVA